MKHIGILLFCILLLIGGTSSTMPKLFHTFADNNEVGSLSLMACDENNYWFSSAWGTFIRYDLQEKTFYRQVFPQGSQIESVMSMELVDNKVWFGLYTLGIAIYNPLLNDFEFYNVDNGLAGFISGKDTYNKVTAMAYDKYSQRVWAGSVRTEISVYDLQKKKWYIIEEPMLNDIDVSSIAVNESYVVVAASGRRGVYYLDKTINEWHFCGEPPFTTGPVGLLTDIFIEDNKFIFMVSDQKSIVQYDIDTGSYSIMFEWEGLLEGMIKYDDYLILSSDKGVTFYNRNTKKHKTFTKAYGLVSNYVNSVYIDGDDMWVLTREGISKGNMQDVLRELAEIN